MKFQRSSEEDHTPHAFRLFHPTEHEPPMNGPIWPLWVLSECHPPTVNPEQQVAPLRRIGRQLDGGRKMNSYP